MIHIQKKLFGKSIRACCRTRKANMYFERLIRIGKRSGEKFLRGDFVKRKDGEKVGRPLSFYTFFSLFLLIILPIALAEERPMK